MKKQDMVNHPPHYTQHPSGVECKDICKHFNWLRGNVIKYVWRAGLKENEIEDLEKAYFYLREEIAKIKEKNKATQSNVTNKKPYFDTNYTKLENL